MPFIKHRPGAIWAIMVLILVSVACVALRTLWPKQGGVPTDDRVWNLTVYLDFVAQQKGASLYLALPIDTLHVRAVGQNYFYPELRQVRPAGKTEKPRVAVFIAPQSGRFHFRADFQLHFTPGIHRQRAPGKITLSPELRDLYLGDEPDIQINNEGIQRMVRQLSAQHTDKDKLLEAIAAFCERKIATHSTGRPHDAAGVLAKRKGTTLGRARLMIALCRAGKIPSRLITGFILREAPEAHPHCWVEVFINGKWVPFDPENGYRGELPGHFVPVRTGGDQILQVKETSVLLKRYSITHIATPKWMLSGRQRNLLEIIDLTRLPLSTQNALITLLVLPIGALLTAFFRNVLGLTTFGTFSPTLLGLAILYADWRTAVVLFAVVVVIGISGRSLLPGLKLMRVPRLSFVFTLVAFIMAFTLSAMEHFNFTPAGYVVLLPLVVLTNIIDRVYTIADEDGKRIALLRLFWTIFVAISCVVVFKWQSFGRLLLMYPELHFSTLALLLLLGLYDARKLTDFPSFRFLAENRKKGKKTKQDGAVDAD